MFFGVISYLQDDPSGRAIRWKQTYKTIKNLCEVSGWVQAPLHIATTNWRKEEYDSLQGLNIIYHTVSMEDRGVARSRNTLLEQFYNSDEDYILMCDDDIKIYPHYDFRRFIELIHYNPDIVLKQELYYICAILANYSPFKTRNIEEPLFKDNWVFDAGGNTAGMNPQIFVNIKKHFGQEIYQKEFLNKAGMGGDDGCYTIDLMNLGLMPYTLTAFIAGTTEIVSTAWNEKKSKQDMLKEAVWEEGQATLDYMLKTYPRLRQITKYRLDFSGYYPPHKKQVYIPRAIPYQFTENDMPKKRTKKVKLGLLK